MIQRGDKEAMTYMAARVDGPSCQSPARYAAYYGHVDILQVLLHKLGDIHFNNDVLLYEAVTGNRPRVVKFLLEMGANPDAWGVLETCRQNGHRYDIADMLLKYGATVSPSDIKGALMWANIPFIKLILSYGTVITKEDWRQWAKFERYENNDDAARFMLSCGIFDDRLDVYKFVDVIDERHAPHLPDRLKRMVIWRGGMCKRLMSYPPDISLTTVDDGDTRLGDDDVR